MANLEENDEELRLLMELQAKGYTPEQIEEQLGLNRQSDSYAPVTGGFDLSSLPPYDPNEAFKDKPDKPNILKSKPKEAVFKPLFMLPSDQTYVLNQETRQLRKLNLKDTIRLTSMLPVVLQYIGYRVPEMLVDEFTGKYRIFETLVVLLERVFADYDHEQDRPTDFAYVMLEELSKLLGIQRRPDLDPVDYLLSCDPEEVQEAVVKLVKYNQGFFLRIWNSSGIIKDTFSLATGTLSKRINLLKEMQRKEKELEEMKAKLDQSISEELSNLAGGQPDGGTTS